MNQLIGRSKSSYPDTEPRPRSAEKRQSFDVEGLGQGQGSCPTEEKRPKPYTAAREIPEVEPSLSLSAADVPSDTEAALFLIRNLFPRQTQEFSICLLPPIILMTQLRHVIRNNLRQLDTQLEALATCNRVLVFTTTTTSLMHSNFQVVFYEDFLKVTMAIPESFPSAALFKKFVTQVLPDTDGCDWHASLRYFTRANLIKRWKFVEDEIRQLVNGGYLGIRDGGIYCLSLPGAGRFIKAYNTGNKAILNIIKKSKFGEVLKSELEKRPLKKSAPLGVSYHLYDVLGSGVVQSVDTTSGPLLRLARST